VSPSACFDALYLRFEKEAEAALALPPDVHSYAPLPIGYPMGRFGPVRRIALTDVVYEAKTVPSIEEVAPLSAPCDL
jgi:hypothetical protein